MGITRTPTEIDTNRTVPLETIQGLDGRQCESDVEPGSRALAEVLPHFRSAIR